MEIFVRLAGQTVTIETGSSYVIKQFSEYLCSDPGEFHICIDSGNIAFERTKTAREDELEGIPQREFPDEYLEFTAIQRMIAEKMFEYDTLVFHGSVVAVDGAAYLFTAKSGTGKSTHTALWRQVFGDRAVMVNDDKPFLQVKQDGVLAYGSPWNGKHGLGENICVPLKAICILERGEENRIREVPPREALFMLLQQSNRPMDRSKMPAYMELLDRLSQNVRFYRMQCNMDPEAAALSYETMSGKLTEREEQYED